MIRASCNRNADKPVAGMPAGTFAIWDAGASGDDWEPGKNPKAHLSKIAFHSALDYIGAIDTIEATIDFPAQSFGLGTTSAPQLIGPHGQSGRPLIIGEMNVDGGGWITCNGMVNALVGVCYIGRNFIFLADDTNVYVAAVQRGSLSAQSVQFRAHILQRTFYADRPDNDVVFHADADYVEAGYGAFDTRRRYIQSPDPGQTPTLYHTSGETMKLASGDELGEIDLGIGNTASNLNVPLFQYNSTSWPPYIVERNPVPLVFGGQGTEAQVTGFDQTGRIYLSNAAGEAIFSTSRKTLTFVEEFKREITIPSRGVTGFNATVPQEVVHVTEPLPDGCDIIFGWIEFLTSTANIVINKPADFSGSINCAIIYTTYEGWVYAKGFSLLSPRINGGNLEIVEGWYNRQIPGQPDTALPAYTARIHIFACALTGGF